MKLIKEIKGHGKNAIVYGKPGQKVELVNDEDAHKLKNPDAVVVVRPSAIGIRTMPFSCFVRDIDQTT